MTNNEGSPHTHPPTPGLPPNVTCPSKKKKKKKYAQIILGRGSLEYLNTEQEHLRPYLGFKKKSEKVERCHKLVSNQPGGRKRGTPTEPGHC